MTYPEWTEKSLDISWERPSGTNSRTINEFISGISQLYEKTGNVIKSARPDYAIHTYYLESSDGIRCKAVSLIDRHGNYINIPSYYKDVVRETEKISDLQSRYVSLKIGQANAMLALPELGLGAISFGKVLKQAGEVLTSCKQIIDVIATENRAEYDFLDSLLRNTLTIDGVSSTEKTILNPLSADEKPAGMLQQVSQFDMR